MSDQTPLGENFNAFMGQPPIDPESFQKILKDESKRIFDNLSASFKLINDSFSANRSVRLNEKELADIQDKRAKQQADRTNKQEIRDKAINKIRENRDEVETKNIESEIERQKKKEELLRTLPIEPAPEPPKPQVEEEKEEPKPAVEQTAAMKIVPDPVKNIQPEEEKLVNEEEQAMHELFNAAKGLSVIPNEIKNVVAGSNKQQDDGEQKNLGDSDEGVSFNKEGYSQLEKALKPVQMQLTATPYHKMLQDIIDKQKEGNEENKKNNIMNLLKLAGFAVGAISLFWPKIRDWLEEKTGRSFQIFENLRGLMEGVGKFFILNKGVNPVLRIIGQTFTGIGELVEGVLKAAIGVFFPIAEKGAGEAVGKAAAGGMKGLLPKIAGGIFGKILGKTVLRSIPVLGGLYSFYLGYNRFKDGDALGGLIDIVGGIGNLLELSPFAPVGLAISWGALALNALLDVTGVTGRDSNKRIGNFFGNMMKGIGDMLMKLPGIKTIINTATGAWDIISGFISSDEQKIIQGFEKFKDIPFLGDSASIWIGLLSMGESKDEKGNKQFSTGNFFDKLKNRILKKMLGWLPSWIRGDVAWALGVDVNVYDEPQSQNDSKPNVKNKNKRGDSKKDGVDETGSPQNMILSIMNSDNKDDQKAYLKYSKMKQEQQLAIINQIESGKLKSTKDIVKYIDKVEKDSLVRTNAKLQTVPQDYKPTKDESKQVDNKSKDSKKDMLVSNSSLARLSPDLQNQYLKYDILKPVENKNKTDFIPTQEPKPKQLVEPAPSTPVDMQKRFEQEIKDADKQIESNKQFLDRFDKIMSKFSAPQSPTIINNSTQAQNKDAGKEYLMTPVFDTAEDKKNRYLKWSSMHSPVLSY